jgi:hypothetical protein
MAVCIWVDTRPLRRWGEISSRLRRTPASRGHRRHGVAPPARRPRLTRRVRCAGSAVSRPTRSITSTVRTARKCSRT